MYIRYEPQYAEEPRYSEPAPSRAEYGAYSARGSSSSQSSTRPKPPPPPPKREQESQKQKPSNPIFSFLPSGVYNPETKKVLGFLKAEDILLIALILLLLENDDNSEPMLVYALLFVLVSDYIDLSGLTGFFGGKN